MSRRRYDENPCEGVGHLVTDGCAAVGKCLSATGSAMTAAGAAIGNGVWQGLDKGQGGNVVGAPALAMIVLSMMAVFRGFVEGDHEQRFNTQAAMDLAFPAGATIAFAILGLGWIGVEHFLQRVYLGSGAGISKLPMHKAAYQAYGESERGHYQTSISNECSSFKGAMRFHSVWPYTTAMPVALNLAAGSSLSQVLGFGGLGLAVSVIGVSNWLDVIFNLAVASLGVGMIGDKHMPDGLDFEFHSPVNTTPARILNSLLSLGGLIALASAQDLSTPAALSVVAGTFLMQVVGLVRIADALVAGLRVLAFSGMPHATLPRTVLGNDRSNFPNTLGAKDNCVRVLYPITMLACSAYLVSKMDDASPAARAAVGCVTGSVSVLGLWHSIDAVLIALKSIFVGGKTKVGEDELDGSLGVFGYSDRFPDLPSVAALFETSIMGVWPKGTYLPDSLIFKKDEPKAAARQRVSSVLTVAVIATALRYVVEGEMNASVYLSGAISAGAMSLGLAMSFDLVGNLVRSLLVGIFQGIEVPDGLFAKPKVRDADENELAASLLDSDSQHEGGEGYGTQEHALRAKASDFHPSQYAPQHMLAKAIAPLTFVGITAATYMSDHPVVSYTFAGLSALSLVGGFNVIDYFIGVGRGVAFGSLKDTVAIPDGYRYGGDSRWNYLQHAPQSYYGQAVAPLTLAGLAVLSHVIKAQSGFTIGLGVAAGVAIPGVARIADMVWATLRGCVFGSIESEDILRDGFYQRQFDARPGTVLGRSYAPVTLAAVGYLTAYMLNHEHHWRALVGSLIGSVLGVSGGVNLVNVVAMIARVGLWGPFAGVLADAVFEAQDTRAQSTWVRAGVPLLSVAAVGTLFIREYMQHGLTSQLALSALPFATALGLQHIGEVVQIAVRSVLFGSLGPKTRLPHSVIDPKYALKSLYWRASLPVASALSTFVALQVSGHHHQDHLLKNALIASGVGVANALGLSHMVNALLVSGKSLGLGVLPSRWRLDSACLPRQDEVAYVSHPAMRFVSVVVAALSAMVASYAVASALAPDEALNAGMIAASAFALLSLVGGERIVGLFECVLTHVFIGARVKASEAEAVEYADTVFGSVYDIPAIRAWLQNTVVGIAPNTLHQLNGYFSNKIKEGLENPEVKGKTTRALSVMMSSGLAVAVARQYSDSLTTSGVSAVIAALVSVQGLVFFSDLAVDAVRSIFIGQPKLPVYIKQTLFSSFAKAYEDAQYKQKNANAGLVTILVAGAITLAAGADLVTTAKVILPIASVALLGLGRSFDLGATVLSPLYNGFDLKPSKKKFGFDAGMFVATALPSLMAAGTAYGLSNVHPLLSLVGLAPLIGAKTFVDGERAKNVGLTGLATMGAVVNQPARSIVLVTKAFANVFYNDKKRVKSAARIVGVIALIAAATQYYPLIAKALDARVADESQQRMLKAVVFGLILPHLTLTGPAKWATNAVSRCRTGYANESWREPKTGLSETASLLFKAVAHEHEQGKSWWRVLLFWPYARFSQTHRDHARIRDEAKAGRVEEALGGKSTTLFVKSPQGREDEGFNVHIDKYGSICAQQTFGA